METELADDSLTQTPDTDTTGMVM